MSEDEDLRALALWPTPILARPECDRCHDPMPDLDPGTNWRCQCGKFSVTVGEKMMARWTTSGGYHDG